MVDKNNDVVDKNQTGISYYDNMIENTMHYYWTESKEWDVQYMMPSHYLQAAGIDDIEYAMTTVNAERFNQAMNSDKLFMPVIDRSVGKPSPRGLTAALALHKRGVREIPVMIVNNAEGSERQKILDMINDGDSYERVKFYSDVSKVPMTRVIYDRMTNKVATNEGSVIFTKAALMEAVSRRAINVKFYQQLQRVNKHDPYVDRILKNAIKHGGTATEAQIRVLAKFASGDHGRWPVTN